jgi:hypothetical protein
MKKILNKGILVTAFLMIFIFDYCFLKNRVSIDNYKIFFVIINIIFSLFIITFIHELGHQIIAIILEMKSSVLVCYPFVLTRKNSNWFVDIDFKNTFDSVGFIIPNIPVIRDLEEYNLNLRKIALAVLVGPITSFLFLIVCLIFPINTVGVILIKEIFVITSLLLVMTSLIYGDGRMFLLLLINKDYALKSLMSFNNHSSNYFSNNYLYNIAKERSEEIDFENIDKDTLFQFEIQSYLIYNFIINCNDNYTEILKKNIESLLNTEVELERLKPEIILYIHTAIIYLISITKDINSADKLYKMYFLKHEKILKDNYLAQRSKYFLGYITSLDEIINMIDHCFEYSISENYSSIEKKLLNQLSNKH